MEEPPTTRRASDLQVSPSLSIPASEIEVRTGPSGGPGGQHANRSRTRVELRFDIEASPSLDPHQRERLLDKLGPVLRVVVDEHRSQARNRSLAHERLAGRLAAALEVEAPRRPTRPSRGSIERRLDDKKRQSKRKRERGWRDD